MYWKSIVKLLLLDLVLRHTASQNDCTSSDRVQLFSVLSPQCDVLLTRCLGQTVRGTYTLLVLLIIMLTSERLYIILLALLGSLFHSLILLPPHPCRAFSWIRDYF